MKAPATSRLCQVSPPSLKTAMGTCSAKESSAHVPSARYVKSSSTPSPRVRPDPFSRLREMLLFSYAPHAAFHRACSDRTFTHAFCDHLSVCYEPVTHVALKPPLTERAHQWLSRSSPCFLKFFETLTGGLGTWKARLASSLRGAIQSFATPCRPPHCMQSGV